MPPVECHSWFGQFAFEVTSSWAPARVEGRSGAHLLPPLLWDPLDLRESPRHQCLATVPSKSATIFEKQRFWVCFCCRWPSEWPKSLPVKKFMFFRRFCRRRHAAGPIPLRFKIFFLLLLLSLWGLAIGGLPRGQNRYFEKCILMLGEVSPQGLHTQWQHFKPMWKPPSQFIEVWNWIDCFIAVLGSRPDAIYVSCTFEYRRVAISSTYTFGALKFKSPQGLEIRWQSLPHPPCSSPGIPPRMASPETQAMKNMRRAFLMTEGSREATDGADRSVSSS